MYKNNVYSFSYDDWKYGMQPSPYSGVSDMRNIDPHTKLGALLCGKKPTAKTNANLVSLPHACFDEANNDIYLGVDGRLVKYNAGSDTYELPATGTTDIQGLVMWKNCVVVAGGNHVEVLRLSGTPTYFDDWQTFEEGTRDLIALPHHVIVGRDDVVYITDGKYIASLQEADPDVAFNPNTPSTYTWNSTALDLPGGYVASSLSEYDKYLIIGSYFSAPLNRGNRADIFPWDKINQSFNNPIRSKGNGVWQSIEYNGRVFALFDKETQRLVQTNLSAYEVLAELRLATGDKMMHPDAIDVIEEEVLLGIGTRSSSASNCGIYGFKQLGDTSFSHLRNELSVGDTGVEIGSVIAIGEKKFIATWAYNNGVTETYGFDLFENNVTDDYSSFVVSPYTIIAREGSQKQFKTIEINLGKKLATGQAVRVSYRANRDDAYTTLKDFTFAQYGAVSALTAPIDGMSPVTGFEVKVELKGSGTTSPEFISLTLI